MFLIVFYSPHQANKMENNNWQNRRHHLRDKRFNNKKIQRPYIGRHREIPYDKHKRQYTRNPRYLFDSHVQSPESSTSSNATIRDLSLIPISHEEAKALKLINAIKSQTGIYGELVFLQTEKDNAAVILQNALRTIKNGILSVMPGKQP